MMFSGVLGRAKTVSRVMLTVASLATVLVIAAPEARATSITYSLDIDLSSGSIFGTGPYGQVTLTENGANIDVRVTLNTGFDFVRTGASGGVNFMFNVLGSSVADITSLVSPFNLVVAPVNTGPAGTFMYGVTCGTGNGNTLTGCKTGGAGKNPPPLTFTVLNAALTDFVSPSANPNGGYLFAADMIGPGGTGLVGTRTPPPPPPPPSVPEPLTLVTMGIGLLAAAGIKRISR